MRKILCFLLCGLLLTGGALAQAKPATHATAKANAAWLSALDFTDERERENAARGLMEAPQRVTVYAQNGSVAWSVSAADFAGDAPNTVNPSLWRNTQLNAYAGLFEVCDGIYQVRGYDMANATFIRTDHGYIVFDVLMCQEDMAAALALAEAHLGKMNIVAVLYSHSHVDHYGGIAGLLGQEDAADAALSLEEQLASGKIPILAPQGFLEAAVRENVYVGQAMARRAQYQYGTMLEQGASGRLAMGIGMGQAVGTVGLIAPTYEVKSDETLTIDGLEIQFQLTPGTEAPAEMNAYFPAYRALWMAENCTGAMHNLYTLRGAQVRDASGWAAYILAADQKFADRTDVVFQSHNWPHWGDEIHDYLTNTAACYQFIHDQTLHYINMGYTSTEIANIIKLPEALSNVWYTRQYYGTLSHNAKAVYQKYMGWYDANPVNLNLLSPEVSAKKLMEYLGDADRVLEKARADYEKGEYQWVAQIAKELVYADPTNQAARDLCADALEQLGYQAESGTWRHAYLSGALELRAGNRAVTALSAGGMQNMMRAMTMDMLLDYIAIITDANAAQYDDLTMNLIVADTQEKFFVHRKNGVLLVYPGENRENAQASVTCARLQLFATLMGTPVEGMKIEGDTTVLQRLIQYATAFTNTFNIIEP